MEAIRPSSPSFNSYSSASVNLTETAARVVEEFRELGWEEEALESKQDDDDDDGDMKEDEFEFAFVCNNKMQESPISADEIFFNGQIKPFYPLFDRPRNRSSLGKLMREERENDVSLSCSSSSEADDLDSLQPGTFCVWTPPEAAAAAAASKDYSSAGRSSSCNRNKSHSMGSSKRWNKLRDLLLLLHRRSNSDDGTKDTFVFLTTPPPTHDNNNNNNNNNINIMKKKKRKKQKKGSAKEIEDSSNNNNKASKAVQNQYVRNRSIKEEDKKLSFSPYRQDLLGFFNDSNGGFPKNLLPI